MPLSWQLPGVLELASLFPWQVTLRRWCCLGVLYDNGRAPVTATSLLCIFAMPQRQHCQCDSSTQHRTTDLDGTQLQRMRREVLRIPSNELLGTRTELGTMELNTEMANQRRRQANARCKRPPALTRLLCSTAASVSTTARSRLVSRRFPPSSGSEPRWPRPNARAMEKSLPLRNDRSVWSSTPTTVALISRRFACRVWPTPCAVTNSRWRSAIHQLKHKRFWTHWACAS